MPFSPEATAAFGSVIHLGSKRDVNSVIDKLRGAVGVGIPYFQDAAKSLPTISASFTDANNGRIQSATVRRIGGGTYGTIWQSVGTAAVYKRTMNKTKGKSADEIEAVYRENYVEGFIQTVLQTDPHAGDTIGRLENIYRDVSIRRRGTRRATAARRSSNHAVRRASSEPLNTTFFYKMEYIRYTFDDAMKKLYVDAGGPIPMDAIHNYFVVLGAALADFDASYGFRHCDLHTGNLMFDDRMNLKIIDFGKSCLKVDGVVYAKNKETCESYDLLILLVSMREFYFHYFDAEVKALINYFFTDADGSNIYDDIEGYHSDYPAQGAIFHYFYTEYSISRRGDTHEGYPWAREDVGGLTVYEKFLSGLIPRKVRPEHFMDVWENPRGPRPPLPALPPAMVPLPSSLNSRTSSRPSRSSSSHRGSTGSSRTSSS